MLVDPTEYDPLPKGSPSTIESGGPLHPNVQYTRRQIKKHLFMKNTQPVVSGCPHNSDIT
jgi:hypothetical protein